MPECSCAVPVTGIDAAEGDSFILAFAGPAAALDFATACQVRRTEQQ